MTSLSYLRFRSKTRPTVVPDVTPCTQVAVYGANVLTDPGFELNRSGGPGGNEIPQGYVSSGDCANRMWWSDESCVPDNDYYWVSQDNLLNEVFTVETANPRSGTFHARRSQVDSGGFFYPRKQYYCNTSSLYEHIPLSAVVTDGDSVDFSIWIASSSGAGTAEIGFFWVWQDETNDTFESTTVNLTSSYQQCSHSGVAPVFTGSVIIQIAIAAPASPTDFFDLDDAVLAVTAA